MSQGSAPASIDPQAGTVRETDGGMLGFPDLAGRLRPRPLGPPAFSNVIQPHSTEWMRSGLQQSGAGVWGRSAPLPPGPSPALQPSGHALGAGTPGMGTADVV